MVNVKVFADRQTDRQTDRRTDRRTGQKLCAPDLSIRGHINMLGKCPDSFRGYKKMTLFCVKRG
jgi:hypothetical protein